MGVGGPDFTAVDLPAAIDLFAARLQRGEVGAGFRLAHADAEIAFSGRDAGEVVALLLLAAEFQHHRTALAVGDPVRADGNGCSQQFLGHDIAFERGTGLTALFLWPGDRKSTRLNS